MQLARSNEFLHKSYDWLAVLFQNFTSIGPGSLSYDVTLLVVQSGTESAIFAVLHSGLCNI